MSDVVFNRAFKLLLKLEGVLSDDPEDNGGITKYGVSDLRDGVEDGKADLDGDGVGDVLIKDLTIEQAKQVYKMDYWETCRCHKLHPALAIALFDTSVNCGPTQAIRFLQRALRVVDDGIIGPITLSHANKANTAELVLRLLAERQSHNAALSDWKRYGRGWSRRILIVGHEALMLTAS